MQSRVRLEFPRPPSTPKTHPESPRPRERKRSMDCLMNKNNIVRGCGPKFVKCCARGTGTATSKAKQRGRGKENQSSVYSAAKCARGTGMVTSKAGQRGRGKAKQSSASSALVGGASDTSQPTPSEGSGSGAGDWVRVKKPPAKTATDGEIADWFRGQPAPSEGSGPGDGGCGGSEAIEVAALPNKAGRRLSRKVKHLRHVRRALRADIVHLRDDRQSLLCERDVLVQERDAALLKGSQMEEKYKRMFRALKAEGATYELETSKQISVLKQQLLLGLTASVQKVNALKVELAAERQLVVELRGVSLAETQ